MRRGRAQTTRMLSGARLCRAVRCTDTCRLITRISGTERYVWPSCEWLREGNLDGKRRMNRRVWNKEGRVWKATDSILLLASKHCRAHCVFPARSVSAPPRTRPAATTSGRRGPPVPQRVMLQRMLAMPTCKAITRKLCRAAVGPVSGHWV